MARCGIFTLVKDERYHLAQWIRYYSQHFDTVDMYILDHSSQDRITKDILGEFDGNVRFLDYPIVFDHEWLSATVHDMQRELLERYEYVLYTDADEIIVPKECSLREFITLADQPAYCCTAYELLEDKMYRSNFFDKTLLSSVPLKWCYGYHRAEPVFEPNGDLFLYHLHKMNFDEAYAKNLRWAQQPWDSVAIAGRHSWQNQITDRDEFTRWFYDTGGEELINLDDKISGVLSRICG